jgi:cell division protein FtsB
MSARATATSPASARGKKRPSQGGGARAPVGLRLTPRATILGFIVFVAAIFAVAPARAYLDQRAQREQLATQVQQLQQQNAALQHQIDQLHDPVELERLARECLGMVDPGEIAIVPVVPGKAPTPPNCD